MLLGLSVLLPVALAVSSRLPRTSAGQIFINKTVQTAASARKSQVKSPPATASSYNDQETLRKVREQYLFEVFEVFISTFDSKLQRIENLDRAMEHLMRKVESLDAKMSQNIEKTNAVLLKLNKLDIQMEGLLPPQIVPVYSEPQSPSTKQTRSAEPPSAQSHTINRRLQSLDRKVEGIDTKLSELKNHLDSNVAVLPNEDINVEASEKKPVSMNMLEITKALNTELINHISKELSQLREATGNIDRKLQFHINLASDNLAKALIKISDIHNAIMGTYPNLTVTTTTTTTPRPVEKIKGNKIDIITEHMKPIASFSEKIDQVWNVVVGTKSSVDHLVPKSDALLSQTQRQERAIGEIHQDLNSKTNKIIANLDKVEKRLKKQENDVASLSHQRPMELFLDPTIDRLVEYDPKRYITEDFAEATESFTTMYPQVSEAQVNATTTATPQLSTTTTEKRTDKRKEGVIFPSIKNKPPPVNTTFATETVDLSKDVRGYSCVDLLNQEMHKSGVYYLQIRGTTYWFLKVFCEQDVADGGWTVIQRRDDFGDPRENFNRDWNDYKNGFGDPAKEFWLGNENIYMLTNNEEYILRVELEDFEGNKRYAQYSHFKIYSEAEYYKLEIDGYEGNAGDSLNDPWYGSNNSPFSTYNRDNDRSSLNCASMLKGGWWWKSCGRGLNGLYLNDPQDLTARQGIVWFRWRGWDYTLKKAMMMIKPKGYVTT